MRSILVDELSPAEAARARAFLDARAGRSGLKDVWWLPLPRELWAEAQERSGEGSFRLAVEAGRDWVRFETLVRSEGLRNVGGGWADRRQMDYLLGWVEEMLKETP